MTVHGHVRNGIIVLDTPTALPEGAAVVVSVAISDAANVPLQADRPVLRHAGTAAGLGRDASRRIDEDLYGAAGV